MKIAKGIELHGTQLRVIFYYRNTKCREGLNLGNTAEDIKLAIQKRDDILSDIRRGKFSYEEHFPNSKRIELFNIKPKSYLMKDLLEQQIKFIHVNNSYSKYTKRDYIGYIDNYLIPVFGSTPVTQLKPIDIKEWILSCSQSPDYVANILIQLRATLSDAQNDGIIEESPLQKLDIKRLFQLLKDKSDYEVDPFTAEERKLIINEAAGEVKWLIQFILFSGLRLGEALALKWTSVNLAERKIKIEYTMSDGELTKPKTPSSIREIHLLDKAFEALEKQLEYKTPDDFVFHNPNTESYWPETDAFRKHWVRLFNKIKLKYRNPYQMRHTFASMLISKGENIHKVAKYLGHKNIKMVIEIYGKYILEESNQNDFMGDYGDE